MGKASSLPLLLSKCLSEQISHSARFIAFHVQISYSARL
jgi:hypothetical protein